MRKQSSSVSNVRIVDDLEPGSLPLPITVTKRKNFDRTPNPVGDGASFWTSLLRRVRRML